MAWLIRLRKFFLAPHQQYPVLTGILQIDTKQRGSAPDVCIPAAVQDPVLPVAAGQSFVEKLPDIIIQQG